MKSRIIDDGTAALAHDAFDVKDWQRAQDINPTLAESVAREHLTMPTVKDLARDFFWAAHKRSPEIAPVVPLKTSHRPHESILNQVLDTPDYHALRAHGTVGNVLLAGAAASSMAADVLRDLPQEARKQIAKDKKDEDLLRRLDAYMQALKDQQDESGDPTTQADTDQKIADAQGKADGIASKMGSGQLSDAAQDAARQAFRKAAKAAGEKIDALANAMSVFGGNDQRSGGVGSDASQNGVLSDDAMRAALALQERLATNPNLARIADIAGRKIRLALTTEIRQLDNEPEEIVGVDEGRDLANVVPSELLLLTDDDAALIFAHRFAQSNLQQYKLQAAAPKHRGPLIIAVDHSISMTGEPFVWAQAIVQSIIAKARYQKRACRVIAFAEKGSTRMWDIDDESGDPEKAGTPDRLIEIASTFLCGGTDYSDWMRLANVAVRESAYEKADTILLSDGQANLDADLTAEFNRLRAQRGMRCFSVVIGSEHGITPEFLGQFSDGWTYLPRVMDDSETTDLLFKA